MAVDIFLEIADIKGETDNSAYPDAIDVTEWKWGLHGGGRDQRRRTEVRNVTLKKFVDRASPNLWNHCYTHTEIEEAKLYFRRAGTNPLTFLTFTLKNVYVASVDTEVGAKGEIPIEVVTLNFNELEAEYQPQDLTGMPDGGTIAFTWQSGSDAL
ncbi:MAG: Hcp family type VI secretion system effector [Planctomycetota bacterium]|jgi:type VI secretion system secreted protein Hcp